MAIGITWKSAYDATTNTVTTFTGSPTWTPAANSLIVCFVCTSYSASPTDPSGVTGHGLTYSQLTLGTSTLNTTHKLSAWVAKAGASPTSVAPVATVTSTNGTGDTLYEFEITGHDNSGTALQAIVASSATNTGTSTTATVTLAAPGSANNRAMTFVVSLSATVPTASGTWTLTAGASGGHSLPPTGSAALFDLGSFNTAGAATTANVEWRMVGIEVKADPNPTVALTGDSATGTTGTVAPALTLGLTGATGTGSVGTVAPTPSVAPTGVTGTGSTGSVSPSVVVALTGNSATGAVGTVTAGVSSPDVTLALTGVSASGSVGVLAPDGGSTGGADYPDKKKRKKKLEAEVARVNREILAEEKTQAPAREIVPKQEAKKAAKKARAQPVVAEIKPATEIAWDDEDDIETLLLSL